MSYATQFNASRIILTLGFSECFYVRLFLYTLLYVEHSVSVYGILSVSLEHLNNVTLFREHMKEVVISHNVTQQMNVKEYYKYRCYLEINRQTDRRRTK